MLRQSPGPNSHKPVKEVVEGDNFAKIKGIPVPDSSDEQRNEFLKIPDRVAQRIGQTLVAECTCGRGCEFQLSGIQYTTSLYMKPAFGHKDLGVVATAPEGSCLSPADIDVSAVMVPPLLAAIAEATGIAPAEFTGPQVPARVG